MTIDPIYRRTKKIPTDYTTTVATSAATTIKQEEFDSPRLLESVLTLN